MRRSLTAKLLLLTLLALVVGIGLIVVYFTNAQRRDLVQEREAGVEQQVAILYESIKNNMLVGNAPIARSLLNDLKLVPTIRDITLWRSNGQEAFSDDSTIRAVNQYLGVEAFEYNNPEGDTGVLPTPAPIIEQSEPFLAAVETQARQTWTYNREDGRELVYYVPLRNDDACIYCHSPIQPPHPDVRGVVRVATSLSDLDQKIQQNTVISLGIWTLMVGVVTTFVIQGMRQLVLGPLQEIGIITGEVAQGNLDVQAAVTSKDEIGQLSEQVNRMIVGLRERLRLTKFVSRATLEEVVSAEPLTLGGEKLTLTVLFSDIRGFTSFADQHDAEEVITILNTYMQRQAGIIFKHGGDVDQFVGDEILGVFSTEDMVRNAVDAAREIIQVVDDLNRTQKLDIHVGIGIHTGPMIAGNIGAQGDIERLQRTVIGDAVNVGSRLCSVAGPGEILISEEVYSAVKDRVNVGPKRTVTVKGKPHPIDIYPVLVNHQ